VWIVLGMGGWVGVFGFELFGLAFCWLFMGEGIRELGFFGEEGGVLGVLHGWICLEQKRWKGGCSTMQLFTLPEKIYIKNRKPGKTTTFRREGAMGKGGGINEGQNYHGKVHSRGNAIQVFHCRSRR